MASLKTLTVVSAFSKLFRTGSCHEFPTSRSMLTFRRRNVHGCWNMGRIVYRCHGNAAEGNPWISNVSHQSNSQVGTQRKITSRRYFRRNFIRTSVAKLFSSSVTCNNEQQKDCSPPSNKTIETTPEMDGPTLFECNSPQAAVRWWTAAFSERGVPEAQVSAEFIVAHALGFKQLHELTSRVLEGQLTEDELDLINRLCNKRKERVPVQYIVGDWDFRDITLVVRPPVFIPRPETEMLVDIILGHYSEEKEFHFLEVGCGSGAISASILTELPLACVTAVDCSEEAVQLTTENAARLGVQGRLVVHHAAFTSDLPPCLQEKRGSFDAIISNPPYIPTQDMENLAPEIKLYEDLGALCSGPDGMDLIRDILRNARFLLKPGGSIWLETDSRHPEAMKAWLEHNQDTGVGFVRTFQDYNYRPRFSQLKFQL